MYPQVASGKPHDVTVCAVGIDVVRISECAGQDGDDQCRGDDGGELEQNRHAGDIPSVLRVTQESPPAGGRAARRPTDLLGQTARYSGSNLQESAELDGSPGPADPAVMRQDRPVTYRTDATGAVNPLSLLRRPGVPGVHPLELGRAVDFVVRIRAPGSPRCGRGSGLHRSEPTMTTRSEASSADPLVLS